ncbi:MAG: NADH-quinone oxidoreductase [Anaerolineaceae bacterium 4572_78]|nr:MAG: NADH-quinone oxidoreductase [Anaerolineaceae bacterium 4572_78]
MELVEKQRGYALPWSNPREKDGALGYALANLAELVGWGRKWSLHPLTFGVACCAIEQISSGASRFDIARFGAEVFRASPRQADLLIVSGRVSNKMAPVIKRLYEQILEPKWVVAMGDCASCGGPFNNYAIIQGVDKIVPVDVYVPGCPPRPEALFYALMKVQDKVQSGDIGYRQDGSIGISTDLMKK